jgi:hypothetical protein
MLDTANSMAGSAKRMYTSVMDLAVIPFVYSTWFNETIFSHPSTFSYAYICGSVLSFAAKEMLHRYKEANPDLKEEEYHIIARSIDAGFKGIGATTEIIFPAIVLDVMYRIRDIFHQNALNIIHPVFVSAATGYGIYRALDSFGIFKRSCRKKETDGEEAALSHSGDASSIIWGKKETFFVSSTHSSIQDTTTSTSSTPSSEHPKGNEAESREDGKDSVGVSIGYHGK